MKNFKETFLRLLIIHDHFATGKMYQDYSWYPPFFIKAGIPVTVYGEKRAYYDAYPFVFGELPHLFSEWEYWAYGKIRYRPLPHLDEDEGLRHFLGLSKKQFAHIFIPTMASVDLGGEWLDIDAKPEQVATNIKIFLENELIKHSKRKKYEKK